METEVVRLRVINESKKTLKINDPETKRRRKALQIYESNGVVAKDTTGTSFKVKSQNVDEPGWYEVNWSPELKLGTCTCHDWKYNSVECKHIIASRWFRHEMGFCC